MFKAIRPGIKEIIPYIKEAIDNNNDVKITVTGYSMYPLLRSNTDDVILSKPCNLKKYDVVLFERENGTYIFHRIIKKAGNVLTIAGDNETKKEYPVYEDAVIGKMKAFVRNGRTHSVNELWYALYSRFWLFIFPFRPVGARVFNRLARLYRKIKGAFGHKKDR